MMQIHTVSLCFTLKEILNPNRDFYWILILFHLLWFNHTRPIKIQLSSYWQHSTAYTFSSAIPWFCFCLWYSVICAILRIYHIIGEEGGSASVCQVAQLGPDTSRYCRVHLMCLFCVHPTFLSYYHKTHRNKHTQAVWAELWGLLCRP